MQVRLHALSTEYVAEESGGRLEKFAVCFIEADILLAEALQGTLKAFVVFRLGPSVDQYVIGNLTPGRSLTISSIAF